MPDSSDVTRIEAAVATGNSATVLALFEQQQKACEEKLRKREAEYLSLTDNLPDGIIRFDRDFQIISLNSAAANIMKSTREELVGKTPIEFPMPMHLASLWHGGVKRALNNKWKVFFEYQFDDLRTVHYLEITMIPELDPDGEVESVLAITHDTSEQKKSVVALRESEDRFRLALGSTPVSVFAQDGSLRYTWVYSSHPNWPAETFLGRMDRDIFLAEEADRMTALKRRVLETGQPAHGEAEVTIAGEQVWLDVMIAPLRNNEGEIMGITGVALDITERKRAEAGLRKAQNNIKAQSDELRTKNEELRVQTEQLRELNQNLLTSSIRQHELTETAEKLSSRLHLLLNTLPVGVMIAEDPECRIISLNTAAIRMFHIPEGENAPAPSLSVNRYFHQGRELTPEEMPLQLAVFGNRDVPDMEIETHLSGGGRWTGLFSATPLRDREGTILGGIAIALDITGRKKAEEHISEYADNLRRQTTQLLASNKELEAFSHSVAHTMRAPLRSIDGFSQALQEEYFEKLDVQARDYLGRIRASAQRMGQLIEDILALSRITRENMFFTKINLSGMVRSELENLRKSEPERTVEAIIPEEISAEGDEKLLGLAMSHLIGNAWKFTAHQPTTKIEFGANREDSRTVYFVRDNGIGFDMQYAANLFTLFFRLHTDEEFPGTGIGLAIVHRIIERHGGSIRAESEPGKGATFYFTLWE
ncbi:MAG: PAS domain-containing sensor histidine kinase [Candidatus Latescibacterota bacterium]